MSTPAERYAAAKLRSATFRQFQGLFDFALDEFQIQACRAVESGSAVLVAAPTGAGKTVVGEYAIFLALEHGSRCFYTTPIKALSNQKFGELVELWGPERVGLLTGDTSINGDAQIVVMTTEVLRNMLYAQSSGLKDLGYVVMDEVHYLADRSRGAVWEEVIIQLPQRVTVVALSATVSNAEEFGAWLQVVRGTTEIIVEETRPIPLWQHVAAGDHLYDLFGPDGEVNPELIRLARSERNTRHTRRHRTPLTPWRSDLVSRLEHADLLPVIYFIFSRAACDDAVDQCLRSGLRLTTKEERAQIRSIVAEATLGIPDQDLAALGFAEWAEALERGIASHHAGLLPAFKEIVELLFQEALVKVVFATETLALGINMPARSVVLEKLVKWNGSSHVDITAGEYTQLTGRAGRRGIDVEGHGIVVWQSGLDPLLLAGLASTRTYPLRSSFRASYNMAVNLIKRMGREKARDVLESSFAQFQADQSVVGLSSQIRKLDATAIEYESSMACHLGDFAEYARLREELSLLEKDQKKLRAQNQRDAVTDSLTKLRVGDVVTIPRGKRAGTAVVVSLPTSSTDARPLFLTQDRQVRRLGPQEIFRPLNSIGRVRVPKGFSSKDSTMKRDLLTRAEEVARNSVEESVDPSGIDSDETHRLRDELRHHPCHGCSDREQHARWAERWNRIQRERIALEKSIRSRTHTVAREFDRVCNVLETLGYLRESEGVTIVTREGETLGALYAESDLVLAESIRAGIFDNLTHAELAGVVSAVVFEGRRADAAAIPSVPAGPINQALSSLVEVAERVHHIERQNHVPLSPTPDAGLVWAIYRWAQGASLHKVLTSNEVTPGDFVRWSRQVIDVLSQLTLAPGVSDGLRDTARQAVDSMYRGVVAYQSTVR